MSIKINEVLIATNPCNMEDLGYSALTVGKEYKVEDTFKANNSFIIVDDIGIRHFFTTDSWEMFFKKKREDKATTQQIKRRTKEDWLKEFDDAAPKIQWFIRKHFGDEKCMEILKYSLEKNTKQLFNILNDIWFKLPDHFNVMNEEAMNNGWGEFLALVEFYDGQEANQILN